MKSFNVFVTDSINYHENNLAFFDVRKLTIKGGRILVWCDRAQHAERFCINDDDAPGFLLFSIPLVIVALCDGDFEAPVLAIEGQPEAVAGVIDHNVELETYLNDKVQEGLLTRRASNLLIDIAREQRITKLTDFAKRNSVSTLTAYKNCGEGIIRGLEAVLHSAGLSLQY